MGPKSIHNVLISVRNGDLHPLDINHEKYPKTGHTNIWKIPKDRTYQHMKNTQRPDILTYEKYPKTGYPNIWKKLIEKYISLHSSCSEKHPKIAYSPIQYYEKKDQKNWIFFYSNLWKNTRRSHILITN